MWIYKQSTGQMFHADWNYDGWLQASENEPQLLSHLLPFGVGYSGCDDHPPALGRNNPDAQDKPDLGPIPQGLYYVGGFVMDTKLGPLAARLMPDHSTNTFGRSGFYIHGDNLHHDASHGCIILDHNTRFGMSLDCANNPDEKILVVVA